MGPMLTIAVAAFALAPQAQSSATPHATVRYEDYFSIADRSEQVRVFNEITPENRADLVRTHVARWLAHNRARLSAEQIALVEEAIRTLTTDLFRLPKDPAKAAKIEDIGLRARKLFTDADVAAFLMLQGGPIPEEPAQEQ